MSPEEGAEARVMSRRGEMLNRRRMRRSVGCPYAVRLVLAGVIGALLCDPGESVTVTDAVPAIPKPPTVSGTRSARMNATDGPAGASDSLACPSERPFLLERAPGSLQLYLLDAAGLHRLQTDGLGITKSTLCTLPQRYDEARMLQVLEIKLSGNEYVLFIITTDQWHNVYLAHGKQPAEAISTSTIRNAQSIQRIKYSGTTSKARLLECNGNIYLVTIVTYANMGKIRVYRWLQSYFSLESTKEVTSIDDVQCHCPSTLLLLVLDYAPLPERSLNHVLLLDAAEHPVKVQEMFFLSSPLHSFTLKGELYLIRHVSRDMCYLYQWTADAKFVRLRKVPYHPGQITTLTRWDGKLAIGLVDGTVRLYGGAQQHLMRVESPFIVRGARQSDATTQLDPASDSGGHLLRLFGLRTDSENEVALAAEFSCSAASVNSTVLKVYQLTVMSVPRAAEAQEQGFLTLNNCLQRLKHNLNERKKWIDLIRLQLSRKNLDFDALPLVGEGASALLNPSVQVGSVVVPNDSPSLLPPSRTVLNGQSLLLRHFRLATDLNQVLLLNRARTEIQGDLHVAGNVRTRCSKIRAVSSLEDIRGDGGGSRLKRSPSVKVSPRTTYRVVKAKEIISDTLLSQRFVQKSKMNVLPGAMQLDELHAAAVRLELGQINQLAVPSRKALQDGADHGYRGHKVFRSVKSYRLNAHRYNGQPLAAQIIESGLRYTNDGITIKTDVCRTRNLMVRGTLNGFRLPRLLSMHQPIQRVKGNLLLEDPVCVKNLQFHHTLNEVTKAELLDRVSNQTITGPTFVTKGFTHNLLVERVNAEPLLNYASTTSFQTGDQAAAPASLLVKSPVRVEKMIILGDLMANHAEQQFAPHIGTRAGDFRQLYLGKLLLNGSLRLKVASINVPNITIMGLSVTSKPYQQFLLRTERQVIDHSPVVAYHAAQFQYLFANTLNGVALWQFSLVHHSWQNSLYLQDATVQGHVRSVRLSKRLLSIKRNRVDVNARVRVCDVRNFVGTLRVAHLHTDSVGGGFRPDVLWRKNLVQPTAAPKIMLGRTTLQGSSMKVRGSLRTHSFNERTAYELAEMAKPAATGRRRFRSLQLASFDAGSMHVLRQEATGELALDEFVRRFVTSATADGEGAGRRVVPCFAKVSTHDAVQQIAVASVGSINFCPVDRLLEETVPKFAGAHAIEGHKRVQGSSIVAGQLATTSINGYEVALLGRVVTRGSVTPQTIDARWSFGAIATSYLTAKVLNRASLSRLALRTDTALLLQSELFIERLQVAELRWPERSGWSFEGYVNRAPNDAYQAPSTVAMLRCYGSIYGRLRDATHVLHELLLAATPDNSRIIEGLVIFDTAHVHFGNSSTASGPAWIERIAKKCLRRGTTPVGSPVVFEHEQVLLTPEPTVVRGDLLATEHSRLMAHTVDDVNVAERLGASADVFRLGRTALPGGLHAIGGEKRFQRHATAGNVTLDRRNPPAFWQRLAFCSHPANYGCAGLHLHFGEVPIVVGQLLTAAQLNRVPLDGFFHAFAKRRSLPLRGSKLHHIQDFLGTLTVTDLRLTGNATILHHINGIPLGELVLRATPDATHQTVMGPKHFRTIRLGGPLSLQHINGVELARLKHTFIGPTPETVPTAIEATVVNRPVLLNGLHTRTLYHSPTVSNSLTTSPSRRQQEHPLAAIELRIPIPVSTGAPTRRIRLNAPTSGGWSNPRQVTGDVSRAVATPGEVILPSGHTTIRAHCSPDQRALVIGLTTRPRSVTGRGSNGTVEQRLHELPSSSASDSGGCTDVAGFALLNATTLLIVVRRRTDDHAAFRYDVPRGVATPMALPQALAVCRHVRLLQPAGTGRELMLATAGCTTVPPESSIAPARIVQIFRLNGAAPHFRHFQTIGTGAPVSSISTTVDRAALLLEDATTNRRHQYVYSSVEGWTRTDVLP